MKPNQKTKNPKIKSKEKSQAKISKPSLSVFEEGNFDDINNILKDSKRWSLSVKSKSEFPVILWLDKMTDKSCLLTIFPEESTIEIPSDITFPISVPITRFPKKADDPPFYLNQFGFTNCKYEISPIKKK